MGKPSKNEPKREKQRADAGASAGGGDVFSRIVELVTDGMTRAAQDPGRAGMPLLEAVTSVVQAAMRGAIEAGADLSLGAKGVVVGVVRGAGEREDAALQTLLHTARTVIRQTADLGGDVAASAKGLVLGAIASAKDLGVDRERAASAAAHGAREGAEESGTEATEKVCDALKEPIGGISVPLPPPRAN